jgi:predicted Zn-dependent peptidase
MRDDDPSDLIHDLFLEKYYGDTPLGRPILGTVESINEMSRSTVFNYYRKRYRPQDLVVAVAGNVKHKDVVRKWLRMHSGKDDFLRSHLRVITRFAVLAPVKVPGRGEVTLLRSQN